VGVGNKNAEGERQFPRGEKITLEGPDKAASGSLREMINLTAISLSSGAANVFSHCVKTLLWCFDYIVIFLYKFQHIYQVLLSPCVERNED